MLGLGCLSCVDGANVLKAGKTKTELGKTTEKHSDAPSDTCPPFCQCTCCCAGYSLNPRAAAAGISICYVISHSSFLPPTTPPGISLPIWQPPQLLS